MQMSRTLVSMAAIKALWDAKGAQKDILDLYVPLLCKVITSRRYNEIDIDQLMTDFKEEYGFCIPRYPLQSLLKRACKLKLVKYSNHRYYRNAPEIEKQKTDIVGYKKSESAVRRLSEGFIQFARVNHNKDLTKTDVEEVILNYLKKYDLNILFMYDSKSIIPKTKHMTWEMVLFSKYILSVIESDEQVVEQLINLALGHILASALLYEEAAEGRSGRNVFEGKYKDVAFFIDTRFVLQLLGVYGPERQTANSKLLSTLQKNMARLLIFDHTYREVYGIIETAAEWVNNPYYDSSLASDATRHFKENGVSKSSIEQILVELPKLLKANWIDRFSVPQYEEQEYVIDEDKLYEMIVAEYKRTQHDFSEEEKRETINKDVDSITAVYYLRKDNNPPNMSEVKYVFITTNSRLAYLSRRFERDVRRNPKIIPTTITAMFLGTWIWMQNPEVFSVIDKNKIIADCYSYLEPTRELRKLMVERATELKANGEIDSDQYTMLLSSLAAKNILMDLTLGSPDEFTDKTPMQIVDSIKAEARNEGILETEARKNIEIEKQKCENKELMESRNSLLTHKEKNERIENRSKKISNFLATVVKRVIIGAGIAIILASIGMQFFSLNLLYRVLLLFVTIVSSISGAVYGRSINDAASAIGRNVYKKSMLVLLGDGWEVNV